MENENKRISQYKKDIVELIGVDMEEIPLKPLKLLLMKSLNFLPALLDKNLNGDFTSERKDKLIRVELGMHNEVKEAADKVKEDNDKSLTCQAFRNNYRVRREGKTAVDFRVSLGTLMSKRIVSPVMTSDLQDDIIHTLGQIFPFRLMTESKLKLVTEAMSKLNIDAAEFLIKEGMYNEKFYYIQSGLFGAVKRSECCYVTDYFKPGQCVGNENLFFGNVSKTTIKCLQAASMWVLDSKTFHSVCHWGLKDTYRFLEKCVSKVPGLQGKKAVLLVNAMSEVKLEPDCDVLAATPSSALYIVFTGRVQVIDVNVRGDEFERFAEPGDMFGRDRLFCTKFAKLSSAVTLTTTVLYFLESEAFDRLFDLRKLYKKSDVEARYDYLFYSTL